MARNSKALSAKQANDLDRIARERFGVSTLVLMENAGLQVAQEALKSLGKNKHVVLFCGTGNNGGDGFVAARHLLAADKRPRVFLAGKIRKVENEARVNLIILLKLKHKVVEVSDNNLASALRAIDGASLIIDALLGVGLKGEVRKVYRALIEKMNSSSAKVLSVDIPSGLDATTGKVLDACVKADKTVTFIAKKRGMVSGEGPRHCGKIIVKGLGIPL